MSDLELGHFVAGLAVCAWLLAAALALGLVLVHGPDLALTPAHKLIIVLALSLIPIGMLIVSDAAIHGPFRLWPGVEIAASTQAAVNRALVLAGGIIADVVLGVRLWETRHRPGVRDR